jgi:hypothetical protein
MLGKGKGRKRKENIWEEIEGGWDKRIFEVTGHDRRIYKEKVKEGPERLFVNKGKILYERQNRDLAGITEKDSTIGRIR